MNRYEILNEAFKKGFRIMPPDGRYSVFMWFDFAWLNVLEKTIKDGYGLNHIPVALFRHIGLPHMEFDVSSDIRARKILFTYRNGVIIDELRYIESAKMWLGKLYWNGTFIDYFWFVPSEYVAEVDFDKIMKLVKI